jgi:hypothetical protein
MFSVSLEMWGDGALPMLSNLNPFSSVADSTSFSVPNLASRGEYRSFDSGFSQRFLRNRHTRVRNLGEMTTDK